MHLDLDMTCVYKWSVTWEKGRRTRIVSSSSSSSSRDRADACDRLDLAARRTRAPPSIRLLRWRESTTFPVDCGCGQQNEEKFVRSAEGGFGLVFWRHT